MTRFSMLSVGDTHQIGIGASPADPDRRGVEQGCNPVPDGNAVRAAARILGRNMVRSKATLPDRSDASRQGLAPPELPETVSGGRRLLKRTPDSLLPRFNSLGKTIGGRPSASPAILKSRLGPQSGEAVLAQASASPQIVRGDAASDRGSPIDGNQAGSPNAP